MSAYFITGCNCRLAIAEKCCPTDIDVYVRLEDLPEETVYFAVPTPANGESQSVYFIGPNAPNVICYDPDAVQVRPPRVNGLDDDGNPISCPPDPCSPEPVEASTPTPDIPPLVSFGGTPRCRSSSSFCSNSPSRGRSFFLSSVEGEEDLFIDHDNDEEDKIRLIELQDCPGSPDGVGLYTIASSEDLESDATNQEKIDSRTGYSWFGQCAFYQLQTGAIKTLEEFDFDNDVVLCGGRRYTGWADPGGIDDPMVYICEPCTLVYPMELCEGYHYDDYYEARSVDDFFSDDGTQNLGPASVWIFWDEAPAAGTFFRANGRLWEVQQGQRTPIVPEFPAYSGVSFSVRFGVPGADTTSATFYAQAGDYERNLAASLDPASDPEWTVVPHIDALEYAVPDPPLDVYVGWAGVQGPIDRNARLAFQNSRPGATQQPLRDLSGDRLVRFGGYCYTFNFASSPISKFGLDFPVNEPGQPQVRRTAGVCSVNDCDSIGGACSADVCDGYRLTLCPGQFDSLTPSQLQDPNFLASLDVGPFAISSGDFDNVYGGPFRIGPFCYHVEDGEQVQRLTPRHQIVVPGCPYSDCDDCVCGPGGVENCATGQGFPWVPCDVGDDNIWSTAASLACHNDILIRVISDQSESGSSCYSLDPNGEPLPIPGGSIIIPPTDSFETCSSCEELSNGSSLGPGLGGGAGGGGGGGGGDSPPDPPRNPPRPDPPMKRQPFDVYHPCGTANTTRGGRRGRNGPSRIDVQGTCYERTGGGETDEGAFIRDLTNARPCECGQMYISFSGCVSGGFSTEVQNITGDIPEQGTVVQFVGNDVCWEVGEITMPDSQPANYNGTPREIAAEYNTCNNCSPCNADHSPFVFEDGHALEGNRCCFGEDARIINYRQVQNSYTSDGRLFRTATSTQIGESNRITGATVVPQTRVNENFNINGTTTTTTSTPDCSLSTNCRVTFGSGAVSSSPWGLPEPGNTSRRTETVQNDCCGLEVKEYLLATDRAPELLVREESFQVVNGGDCCYDPDIGDCATEGSSCDGAPCPSGDMP